MDFPVAVPILPVISCWSMYAIGSSGRGVAISGIPSTGFWPAADLAISIPFTLPGNYVVRALWWWNGAAVAGNVDCGIYTESGGRLTSTGSTAQAGTNTLQSVTLGTPLLLTAGNYNMALVLSSASGVIGRHGQAGAARLCGLTQMAAAFPLPASFTMAAAANEYIPYFGIASRTLI